MDLAGNATLSHWIRDAGLQARKDYSRGKSKPQIITRAGLAQSVWKDSHISRQLVDHYESTITLSRLELVVLALEALKSRLPHTTKYFDGDLSYALAGLVRQRPKVDSSDSAFQAFARLSLVNDSDRLLERMLCVLPEESSQDQALPASELPAELNPCTGERPERHPEQRWANLDDQFGVKLWDIEPYCQVAAIDRDNTVIIDGAFAATIHWDTFAKVAMTTRETPSRMAAKLAFRSTSYMFIIALTLCISGSGPNGGALLGFGVIFMIAAVSLVLVSPALAVHFYGGKVWFTQPWLFGFEGYMPVDQIERHLFGFPSSRLRWTPCGSALSRSAKSVEHEWEALDPVRADAGVRRLVEKARKGDVGDKRVFTLVDTNTMTVTLFEARRPPVVALLCGAEGGMQRAVMCSYDWTSQTLYRQTVLRMETLVLGKISRVGRVKVGMWHEERQVVSRVSKSV